MRSARGGVALVAATIALSGLSACGTIQAARERLVKAPPSCDTQTVAIYFEPESAEVTKEGRAVIREAAETSRGCVVERVQVVGLADAVGAPGANLELSKRRANSVAAALTAAGLPAAEFDVAAAGQAGAVAPSGEARPLRRRAEVTLHLKPRPR